MRSLWAATLLLRRLRSETGIAALICLLVALTSFLFAAGPRLFGSIADEALRHAVGVATPGQRSIEISLAASLRPGASGGIAEVRAYGDQLAERIPPGIEALVEDRTLLVTAVRLLVTNPPSYETHVTLRYQDRLVDTTRLVDGRWPVDRGLPLRLSRPGSEPGSGDPVVIEVAFSAATATEIGVRVGDRLAVKLDDSDVLMIGVRSQITRTDLEVVGLYEALDQGADAWAGDRALLEVSQHGDDDNPIAFATAYIAAETYPSLWESGLPFRYAWRHRLDPARFEATNAGQLTVDLRRLSLLPSSGAAGSERLTVVTGLPAIVERFVAQVARTESVLAVGAVGPLGLAAGAIGMVATLLAGRRRATLALARGRGATGSLVLGTGLLEAALLAGGAALVGLVAALAFVPGRPSPISPAIALMVAAAAAALLVGATWPAARGPLRLLDRDDAPIVRIAPRRLVFEGTVVVLALAATLLLRQRGVGGVPGAGGDGADPLLASVPLLGGLAAGIVALRLYPLPVRALGWLAARGRGFVPVTGLRMIARNSAAANLPLLVLLLTSAFGSFASVVTSSLDRGQVDATYLELGADYRLEPVGGSVLPPSMDPASIPGVSAVAGGLREPTAALASTPRQRAAIFLEALDPVAYDAVTAGTAADPRWPEAFLRPFGRAGLGTDANPIPAILSLQLPSGSADLQPGDTFRLSVRGEWFVFRLMERRATFPGIVDRPSFAVVPFDWVQAAFEKPPPASVLWLRASADAAEPLAAAITAARGSVHVFSRHAAYAALRDAPLIAVVGAGYSLAVVLAAVYMALTIVGAVVLSAARRTRDLAFLRTLGATAGQGLALTVVEHAPPVVLGIVPGVLLGIGIAVLTEPGLGLAGFIGSPLVPLSVDVRALGLLVALLVAVDAVAIAVGTWLSRRTGVADALRMGEH